MKTCRVCKETKPIDSMVKDRSRKDGVRNICKPCDAQRMRDYFKNNPEKYEHNKAIPRDSRPNWKRHNISKEIYEKMLGEYDGKCHSCKTNKATVIDHDHGCCSKARSCGKCVRGLLCNGCNASLGHLKDDLDMINNLMLYLTSRGREGRSFSPVS